jgi:hypothetical protein
MKKFLGLFLALMALAPPVFAEDARFVTHTFQSAADAVADGTALVVDKYTAIAVQVTISNTATVTFEGSQDGSVYASKVCVSTASTSAALSTTATATGTYQCNIAGLQMFRVRVSAWTSGTVTVTGRATTAVFGGGGAGGGGGTLVVAEVDGAPSVSGVTSITLTNGRLTDDGSGAVSVDLAEADTSQTVFARGKVVSTANSFANAKVIGDGTNATAIYTDASAGPQIVCSIAGVENDCDYVRKLAATKKSEIQNSSGTAIFTVTEDTAAITNAILNVESTGNTLTTVAKANWATVGCAGTTGTLLLDVNATLAPTATCTAGSTNTTLIQGYADFPDSDGDYSLQIPTFRLPSDLTGAVDLQLYWKAAATSGDVVWQVATMCTSDAEIEDVAWNAADAFTADTAKGTTLQLNTASKTGITMTNCAAGDLLHMKILRNRTHASDTITGVVSLKSFELTLRRAQ